MAIQLGPADMADPTSALAQVPSGTAAERQVVLLPPGEFETDLLFEVADKRFWNLIGGPTTLHFPTYGPMANDGNFERRHCRFESVSDFYIGGLRIRGPHTVKSVEDPTRAKYDATKAFQHGFVFARSHRVTVEDLDAYEIGGDGIYVNDTEDLHVLGFRVEFNGRQGLAGIEGERWLFERVQVVNAGRNAVDFEPVGSSRWIDSVTIRDSELTGGVALHRISAVTFERDRFRQGAIIATGSTVLASRRRYGIRILDNDWPDGFRSKSRDAAPIQLMSVNGAEIRGNRCHRDPTDDHTTKSVFVEMRALPVTGHITIQDNDLADFVAPFKWRNGLIPPTCVTTDIQGSIVEPTPEPPPEVPTVSFPIRQQLSRFLTGTSIAAGLRVAPLEGSLVFAAFQGSTLTAMDVAGFSKAVERQGSGIAVQLWYKRAGASESPIVIATSTISAALKLHVFEMPGGLFVADDPLDVVASNDSGATPVNTLATGTTPPTSQVDELAVTAVAAVGGNRDFRLTDWTDDFTALSDHETEGLMVAFKVLTEIGGAGASATWTQQTAPSAMKAAGAVATFKLAGPFTPPTPTPRRVSAGTRRAKLNTTGTVDTIATFPVVSGRRYLCFVGASKTGGITADCTIPASHGGALDWNLIASHFIGLGRRVHAFEALATADAAAAPITIITPAVGMAVWWLVLEITGPNNIRQVAVADEPIGATFVEASFTNVPLDTSAVVGLCLHGQPEPQLVDVIPDVYLLYAGKNVGDQGQWCSVQWFNGTDQTLRWDWASTIHALVVMLEVGD